MSNTNAPSTGLQPNIWAAIVWACMLGGITLIFTPIIGVIIAHVQKRKLANTPFGGHLTAAIWTFWLTTAVFFLVVLGVVVLAIGLDEARLTHWTTLNSGLLVAAAVGLWVLLGMWFLFRSGKGMILALNEKPWVTWLGIF